VAGLAEHADVRARAEDALLGGGEDDRAHLGMLEPQPLHGVVELDVHAEVIGVELELVAGHEATVLPDVHGERGHAPVQGELPVPVAGRLGAEVHGHAGGLGHCLVSRYPSITQRTLARLDPRFSQTCGLPPSR